MAEIGTTASLEDGTVEGQLPATPRSPVEQVADILKQGSAPAEATPETGSPADSEPNENWDIKAVAERLGADPAKLYSDLKVAFEDGTEVTVSALKDAYRPAAELEKARNALWEDVSAAKLETSQAQQELGILLQMLGPQNLSQDVLRKVNELADQQRKGEAERLLKVIPEWKDPITRAADWVDIRQVGKQYGYTDAELRLAEQGHADSRLIAALRALAKGPKPASTKPAPKVAAAPTKADAASPAQRLGRLKTAVTKGQLSKTDAVAQILKGL